MFPPGRCSNRSVCAEGNTAVEPYLVMHNILRAHSRVAALYRAKYQVGTTAPWQAAVRVRVYERGWGAHRGAVGGRW